MRRAWGTGFIVPLYPSGMTTDIFVVVGAQDVDATMDQLVTHENWPLPACSEVPPFSIPSVISMHCLSSAQLENVPPLPYCWFIIDCSSPGHCHLPTLCLPVFHTTLPFGFVEKPIINGNSSQNLSIPSSEERRASSLPYSDGELDL